MKKTILIISLFLFAISQPITGQNDPEFSFQFNDEFHYTVLNAPTYWSIGSNVDDSRLLIPVGGNFSLSPTQMNRSLLEVKISYGNESILYLDNVDGLDQDYSEFFVQNDVNILTENLANSTTTTSEDNYESYRSSELINTETEIGYYIFNKRGNSKFVDTVHIYNTFSKLDGAAIYRYIQIISEKYYEDGTNNIDDRIFEFIRIGYEVPSISLHDRDLKRTSEDDTLVFNITMVVMSLITINRIYKKKKLRSFF